jgi:cyclic pyranopterin phosphate synthase
VEDRIGRPLRDLRISVTDRCNFRCRYCMPKEHYGPGHVFLAREEILSFEEIARVARAFAALGLRKVRLTGGEPLLRADLPKLVELLARIPNVDLALTTNGSLLAKSAETLKRAGLHRVTVSLDALDDATFRAVTDADYGVSDVLEGIDAASRAGFSPIKINCVVRRGLNDSGIVSLARQFKGTGHIVRFIEYMDVGITNGWRMDDVVSGKEVVSRIQRELPIEPLSAEYRGEVAKRWRYADGTGEIGVITSVTQPFCGDCSRARISSEGKLYTCLFATQGTDLRALIRNGASDADLEACVREAWSNRSDRYSEIRSDNTRSLRRIEMSYIGG